VDFSLSAEQVALVALVEQLATEHFGPSVAREFADGDHAVAAKGWSALVDTGLTALLLPEQVGGGAASVLEICLVLRGLVAALAPVPYLTTAAAAPLLLRAFPGETADRVASEICDGQGVGLVVDHKLRLPGASDRMRCIGWSPECAGLAVIGGTLTVLHSAQEAASVDLLDRVGLVAVPADFAPAGAGEEPLRRALAGISAALAAGLAGVVDGCARLAWNYARTRQQYGAAIGTFQAVRHMAADLLVDVETCRSVALGAAWTVDNADLATAERSAAIAKVWCGQAAVRSAETCMQILGGIGATWESPAHLYLRRARSWSALLGEVPELTTRLGQDFIASRGAGSRGSP
jgi:alkylation response protein AidB-like acyl-CoA dehydrogenase